MLQVLSIESLKDLRISNKNRLEFNKRGWTLVNLELSEELIRNAIIGLERMKFYSLKNEYKPKRIYFDHLFHNNIAAIELPFNKDICNENIKDLFKEAKIGSLVKSLMNWQNPCCDLARLFCMGDYNYRGKWHRDYTDDLENIHQESNQRKIVLVGIYLLPQKGFRLLKKSFDYKGENSIIKNKSIDKLIRSFPFSLSPPSNTFDEINGKIGTALFFDPLLIHQGSNYSSRLDFHLKFFNSVSNKEKSNRFQDFSVVDVLHENFLLPSDCKNILKVNGLNSIPFDKRIKIINRIFNTLDYRTCIKRIFKMRSITKNNSYELIKSQGWKIDFFSNTIFQK